MTTVAQTTAEDGIALYKRGSELFRTKQFEQALVELGRSYELLPSPNTLLLMAHAQRELNNRVKAIGLYEQTRNEAARKAEQGEERFRRTEAEARKWYETLSQQLGRLTVVVRGMRPGVVVEVDHGAVDVPLSGAGTETEAMARVQGLWHEPGSVSVSAKDKEGQVLDAQQAEVGAGRTTTVELSVVVEDRGAPPDPPEPRGGGATIPAGTWVSGGIALAGVATFATFGWMAKSKYDDVKGCQPACTEDQRDTAQAGERDQTIANVGLVVGGAGVLGALGFFVFSSSPDRAAKPVSVSVGPGMLELRGRF